MSRLLVVQPDPLQAHVVREALYAQVSENVVITGSLDEALSSIDRDIPDVVLLPTLMPPAVEDYLVTYLGTIPGARHVQILGLPCLERSDGPVQPPTRSLFPWRRRQAPRSVGTSSCDPGIFTRDVVAYLASARTLKQEFERYGKDATQSGRPERRSEPRFANDEMPWISVVRFGTDRADLLNVSTRGVLLRTRTRPSHHFLRRSDPSVRGRGRVTLELGPDQIHVMGRVIRCVPVNTHEVTQYEIAFSFDQSIGLHLPSTAALISTPSTARSDGG